MITSINKLFAAIRSRRVGIILTLAAGTAVVWAQQPASTPPAAASPAGIPGAGAPALAPLPGAPTAEPAALTPIDATTPGAAPALPPPAVAPPLGRLVPPPGIAPGTPSAAYTNQLSVQPAATVNPATPADPGTLSEARAVRPGRRAKAPGASNRAGSAVGTISLGMDMGGDPRSAAQQYEAFIANFDSQREAAAHAVFGLGETYRKLGRIDEARVQYGRVLREFTDFSDLARQSQQLLSTNLPAMAGMGPVSSRSTGGDASRSQQSLAEERELVLQELQLLENELETTRARISQGVETPASAVPIQREILQLKQRLVRMRTDEPSSMPRAAKPEPLPAPTPR